MFGYPYVQSYRPKIKADEELHELIIDLNDRPTDQNATGFMLDEVAKKANRLGKEKRKIHRMEYDTDKISAIVTVWFICEHDLLWGR